MLQFKQNDTEVYLILTLTELITAAFTGTYFFQFTHVTTKQQVTFSKLVADDESLFQYRYNKFKINPSVVFLDKPLGEWHYKIYENTVNGAVLEQGKMILDGATEFAFTKYDSANSFKAYNG